MPNTSKLRREIEKWVRWMLDDMRSSRTTEELDRKLSSYLLARKSQSKT